MGDSIQAENVSSYCSRSFNSLMKVEALNHAVVGSGESTNSGNKNDCSRIRWVTVGSFVGTWTILVSGCTLFFSAVLLNESGLEAECDAM